MEITELQSNAYTQWDEFCLDSDEAWFWHTSNWLEYTLAYKPELSPISKSFFVRKKNKTVAICPLILETKDGIKEFSYGNGPCPIPVFRNDLSVKQRKQVMRCIFDHINKLAQDNSVKRGRMRFSVLAPSFFVPLKLRYNYLTEFGYIDTSLVTQVIDLKKPLGKLKTDLRHGHRSDIARAQKTLGACCFDYSNITKEVFDAYRVLHREAAGKITRPQKTFDLMYQWIQERNAFLVGVKKDNKWVGFSYFFVYKNNVCYGSACKDPGEEGPIGHITQWEAIQFMKERGCVLYEIGLQQYGNTLFDFPTKKEINISLFKRGFGGFAAPFFLAEKYYDKKRFLSIFEERIQKFAGSLSESEKRQ